MNEWTGTDWLWLCAVIMASTRGLAQMIGAWRGKDWMRTQFNGGQSR